MPKPDASFFDPTKPQRMNLYGQGGGGGSPHDYLAPLYVGSMFGHMAWDAAKAGFDAAATPDQKLAVLQAAGMSKADAAKAYATAQSMQRQKQYSALSVDQLLGLFADNWRQTHSVPETTAFMPTLANSATILTGMGMGDAADSLFSLTRAGDLSGLLNNRKKDGSVDLTQIKDFFADTVAMEQATGDALDPGQILRLYQNMGPAAFGLSDTGRQAVLALALGLGQQKAGTGINQMFKELVGGKMSIGSEATLKKMGLIDTKGAVRTGEYVRLAPNSLVDEKLFQSDPVQWFMKDFAPAVQGASPQDRASIVAAIYAASGTTQGGRVVADSILNNPFIQRELGYANGVPTLQQSAAILANSPQGTAAGAGNALNALLVTLSNDTMSVLMPALTGVRYLANAANNAATAHPVSTGETMIDAALATIWGALKGGSKLIFPSSNAAIKVGGFADGIADMATGPVGIFAALGELLYATSQTTPPAGSKFVPSWRGGAWVPGGDSQSKPGSSPDNPVYTKTIVTNGVPLVSPSPTMPSGQNSSNPSKTPPMPGQVNRLSGHQ